MCVRACVRVCMCVCLRERELEHFILQGLQYRFSEKSNN